MNNWKNWLKGLAAIALGGAATGAAGALGSGRVDKSVAVTAGVGALSTVAAYLLRSPLLSLEQKAGETEKETVSGK